ncbi:hypothetical protein JCGZ_21641 [Jatropha curcas]|uniref:Pectinesterase inhibitor domain-containing protein n=2 Tax=Jatropha curcas TaxID=180498 RepID=A0A067JMF0_JATCU|nr:hypothetical protein JCGZ_21641 [Jatropha curcas]
MSVPRTNPPFSLPFFLLFLILSTTCTASSSFFRSYSQYKTVVSLSHSLLTRVSNLRAARGDIDGANRAKLIAQKLEKASGLGFWGLAWSVGWDYAKNYAWRDLDYRELYGVVSDLNELAGLLSEFARAESDVERASWIARSYSNIFSVAKSVLQRFLRVFRESGALKEAAETVRREVVDGGLLRDCLELGSDDLKGLVQIIKDLASQFFSTSDYNSEL